MKRRSEQIWISPSLIVIFLVFLLSIPGVGGLALSFEAAKMVLLYLTGLYLILVNLSFANALHYLITHCDTESIRKEFFKLFIIGLSNIACFAIIFYLLGLSYDGSRDLIHNMGTSLYFSIVTWTTLGYGDFQPIGYGRYIAAAEALMGYVYMALLVGMFVSLIQARIENNRR